MIKVTKIKESNYSMTDMLETDAEVILEALETLAAKMTSENKITEAYDLSDYINEFKNAGIENRGYFK